MSEEIPTMTEKGLSMQTAKPADDVEDGHHTTGQLQQSYGLWSLCAQAIVLPGSWAFAATALTIAIFGGGSSVAIWGTICISFFLWIVVACLAEMGSAYPSAAGCTFIAYKVSGPRWGRFCVSSQNPLTR
jgi:choline transport protein